MCAMMYLFSGTNVSSRRKEVFIMDIAGLSMDLSTISTSSKVGTAVLSKAMDTNEALGQGLVEMIDAAAMERSVNPAVGANFDMRV